MAEKLEEFPGGPTRTTYPWGQWLDGSVWLLRKGEDYEVETASMRAAASKAAKAHGKKLRTRIVTENGTEGLAIQAYD